MGSGLGLCLLMDYAVLRILYLPFALFAGLWIYIDANQRVGNGCFWGALTLVVPPIGIPLYYGSLLALHLRSVHTRDQFAAERAETERVRKLYTAQGELGRQKLLDQAQTQGGTLFGQPPGGVAVRYRHFTDERAEQLLAGQRQEEAYGYLSDLYQTACAEHDPRARETYLYYLNQIPGALDRLQGTQPAPPAKRGFD